MKTQVERSIARIAAGSAAVVAAAALMSFSLCGARAQGSVAIAPPVHPNAVAGPSAGTSNASLDSVFNWSEVPQNREVRIQRALFDQGGYQLIDTAGETIVVPFTNNNLYVMQFAQTKQHHMYFVNTGAMPILYVPKNGYLENNAVPGARWYPFSKDFHPATPVYLSCAPDWAAFVGMVWYPGMICTGGYWCHKPIPGAFVAPSPGLRYRVGGNSYSNWQSLRAYSIQHPSPYGSVNSDRPIYRWGSAPHAGHVFRGAGPAVAGRGPAGSGPAFGGERPSGNGGFGGRGAEGWGGGPPAGGGGFGGGFGGGGGGGHGR